MATYRNEKNKEIAFPLGGIGSGCVSLAGNGGLVDWEVQNTHILPSKRRGTAVAWTRGS